MRVRYAPLLALALALVPALLVAAPPVDVPAEVKGDVGAFVPLRAKTDGAVVKFVALDAGLNVFPADLLADKRATVVTATKPGRYRVLAYSSVKDDPTEPAIVTVVIGDAPVPPGPNPPGPGPGPNPPGPTDPLVKLLADAYATETAVDKRERCRALADVMRFGAKTANDPTVTLNANVAAAVSARRKGEVGDALPAVRKAIGQYLGGELGDAPKMLDAELRAKTAAAYTKLADALNEVAK